MTITDYNRDSTRNSLTDSLDETLLERKHEHPVSDGKRRRLDAHAMLSRANRGFRAICVDASELVMVISNTNAWYAQVGVDAGLLSFEDDPDRRRILRGYGLLTFL